jgi:hypothetical protein
MRVESLAVKLKRRERKHIIKPKAQKRNKDDREGGKNEQLWF